MPCIFCRLRARFLVVRSKRVRSEHDTTKLDALRDLGRFSSNYDPQRKNDNFLPSATAYPWLKTHPNFRKLYEISIYYLKLCQRLTIIYCQVNLETPICKSVKYAKTYRFWKSYNDQTCCVEHKRPKTSIKDSYSFLKSEKNRSNW